MRKRFLALVLIILLLSACTQPTTAPTPTVGVDIGDGGVLSGEPCEPPCFMSITPGLSTKEETIAVLQGLGVLQDCDFYDNSAESGSRGIACRSFAIFRFQDDADIVAGVGFKPTQNIFVEDVFKKFGEPNAVLVVDPGLPHSEPKADMMLYYDRWNMTVLLPTQEGYTYDLKLSVQVVNVAYADNQSYAMTKQYSSSWQGLGAYTASPAPRITPSPSSASAQISPASTVFFNAVDAPSPFNAPEWTLYKGSGAWAYDLPDAIHSAPDGVFWFSNAEQGTIIRYDGAEWKMYDTGSSLVAGTGDNKGPAFAATPDGRIWFGSADNGLFCFDGTTWTIYSTQDGLVDNHVTSLAVGTDGILWVGTKGGVSRYNEGTWVTYTTENGLADNRVLSMAIAVDGTLWFGTESGYASHFDGSAWSSYKVQPFDAFASNHVYSIATTPDGITWFGARVSLARFDGDRWITYDTGGIAPIYKMQVAPDRTLWLSPYLTGLFHVTGAASGNAVSLWGENAEITHYNLDDEAPGSSANRVTAMEITDEGTVWIGTYDSGIFRYDGQAWTNFRTNQDTRANFVKDIEIAPDGSVWFATSLGLLEYKP